MNTEAQAFETEETTDPAAPGALEVTGTSEATETGIAVLPDPVLPAIPESLNINGVELNITKLTAEIAEIKLMTIDGLGDEKGYLAAKEKLAATTKLRTSSDKWRQKVMAPLLKFGKDLKKPIDEAEKLCKEGEEYLKKIIKPIDDAVEIARQEAEKAKDDLAAERATLLIAIGGVFDGKGTYNFEHNAGAFFLSTDLREMTPEKWDEDYKEVKDSWDLEQQRLQDIEDAKNAETNLLKGQVEDLNKERTAFRIKELVKFEGFTESEDKERYTRGELVISKEQVLTTPMEEWDALLNPVVEEVPEVVAPVAEAPAPVKKSGGTTYGGAIKQGYVASSIASDFATEPEPASAPIAEAELTLTDLGGQLVSEAPAVVESTFIRSFVFSETKPFIDFAVGQFTMRIYPIEKEIQANTFLGELEQIALNGTINEQLNFLLIKK